MAIDDDLKALRRALALRLSWMIDYDALGRVVDEYERLRGPIRTSEAIDWRLTAAEIEAQYRAMAQECERLRADAARYHWLRDRADTPAICESDDDGWYPLIGAAIESSVDAAMQRAAKMTLDELTQKASEAYPLDANTTHDQAMRAAVLAILAEVREMVPEEMPAAHGALVSFAVVQAHNACRAEMLRRLDAMEGK